MPKLKCTQKFPASMTIPGQSLYPSDLMKRHLAGTLPPIDLSAKYEHHYDENGEEIAKPMPTEYYELHNLAVALRKKQFEAATEHRKQQAEKERKQIIDDYIARHSLPTPPAAEGPTPTPVSTHTTPTGARSKKTG